MSQIRNHFRAVRYRKLALAETDRAKADLLFKIADEADRDVLCTSDSTRKARTGPDAPNAALTAQST
jgi:hypothetical protein